MLLNWLYHELAAVWMDSNGIKYKTNCTKCSVMSQLKSMFTHSSVPKFENWWNNQQQRQQQYKHFRNEREKQNKTSINKQTNLVPHLLCWLGLTSNGTVTCITQNVLHITWARTFQNKLLFTPIDALSVAIKIVKIKTMKLLTYNFLTSTAIKGVKVGFPLILHVSLWWFFNFLFLLHCKCTAMCFIQKLWYRMNFSIVQVVSKQEVETDFNAEFLTRMIPRLEWPAVLEGAKAVCSLNQIKSLFLIHNWFVLLSDWMPWYITRWTTTNSCRRHRISSETSPCAARNWCYRRPSRVSGNGTKISHSKWNTKYVTQWRWSLNTN